MKCMKGTLKDFLNVPKVSLDSCLNQTQRGSNLNIYKIEMQLLRISLYSGTAANLTEILRKPASPNCLVVGVLGMHFFQLFLPPTIKRRILIVIQDFKLESFTSMKISFKILPFCSSNTAFTPFTSKTFQRKNI